MDKPMPISEHDLEQRYDDFLDEVYDMVKIGSLTYMPSDVLKSVDPTAYRCGFSDWLDSESGQTIVYHENDWYDLSDFEAWESEQNEED